jgi:hypothetical protein
VRRKREQCPSKPRTGKFYSPHTLWGGEMEAFEITREIANGRATDLFKPQTFMSHKPEEDHPT